MKDLFASAARRKSNDKESSSSSSDEESKRCSVELASGKGVVHPYKSIGHSFIPESPQHGKKKRKRVKSSARKMKSSLRLSSEKQKNTVIQDPPEPWFEVGDKVIFDANNVGVAGTGTVMGAIRLTSDLLRELPDGWYYEVDAIAEKIPGRKGWLTQDQMKAVSSRACLMVTKEVGQYEALHPLNYVGMDTCSAMSVSTEESDFLYLDTSPEARSSVELNGVGGGNSKVQGRGPMMVSAQDTDGNWVFLMDPAGVFLKSSVNQARFRIYGQQRMKAFGFYLQQNRNGDGEDYLVYKDQRLLKAVTKRGIQMIKTGLPLSDEPRTSKKLLQYIQDLLYNKKHDHCIDPDLFALEERGLDPVKATSLIINEAKLTRVEKDRLDHWRTAHRTSSGERFNERCSLCEKTKHKASFKRNLSFNGTSESTAKPY